MTTYAITFGDDNTNGYTFTSTIRNGGKEIFTRFKVVRLLLPTVVEMETHLYDEPLDPSVWGREVVIQWANWYRRRIDKKLPPRLEKELKKKGVVYPQ